VDPGFAKDEKEVVVTKFCPGLRSCALILIHKPASARWEMKVIQTGKAREMTAHWAAGVT